PVADDSFGLFDEDDAAAPVDTADEGFGFFDDVPAAPAPKMAPALSSGIKAAATPAKAPAKPAAGAENSIRVSIEKTDQLINLVGELVITQAMLDQLGADLEQAHGEKMQRALGQLSRNTRQLQ